MTKPAATLLHRLALALGPGVTGSGTIQFIDSVTGAPGITGRFRGQTQGRTSGRDGGSTGPG